MLFVRVTLIDSIKIMNIFWILGTFLTSSYRRHLERLWPTILVCVSRLPCNGPCARTRWWSSIGQQFVRFRPLLSCSCFNLQCPSYQCTLYETGSQCTSQCIGCGVLCEAFPITDLPSLQLYSTQGCTIVVGDLYIMTLPVTLVKKVVFNYLMNLRTIRGNLYIVDNQYLSGMTFFSNLVSIQGEIYYNNNPTLTDARMPALTQLYGPVVVNGCDRLCPARYTVLGASPSDAGCANNSANIYLHVNGNADSNGISTLCSIIGNAAKNVSNGSVRCTGLYSHHFHEFAVERSHVD